MWVVYLRPQYNPALLYNHFRVDHYTSPDHSESHCFQQWYSEVSQRLALLQGMAQEPSQSVCGFPQGCNSFQPSNTAAASQSAGCSAKRTRPSPEALEPLVSHPEAQYHAASAEPRHGSLQTSCLKNVLTCVYYFAYRNVVHTDLRIWRPQCVASCANKMDMKAPSKYCNLRYGSMFPHLGTTVCLASVMHCTTQCD